MEVSEASTLIQEQAHEDAKIIWGLVYDPSMQDTIRITVIATGFEERAAIDDDTADFYPKGKLFDDDSMPSFMKKKVAIDYKVDYKEIRQRSDTIDIDDDRYDIPTFLRKQAD
jgi:cell division protein FtsZ